MDLFNKMKICLTNW